MKKNYFKNLMQVSLLLGAAFVITSCDDIVGQEDNPVASYLQWDASVQKSYTLKIGQTATVKAVAVSSAVIVYESGDEEVAKVNPVSGEITAVGVGKTVIKAVVTGASSAGQSVFQTTSVEVPIEVKDGNAKLTRVKDEVVEYTVNVDSVIDLTKLFTAYPEVGTGAQKSTVAYTILGKNDKKTPAAQNLATINAAEVKILANGTIRDWYEENSKKGTDISDTLYVEATLTPNDTKEYKVAKPTDVVDTIMVIINKSIAYINAKGEREILTADKYKELDLTTTSAVEAGTYYVTKAPAATPATATDIKGDVTLIFKDKINAKLQNLDDKTDKATLNIFGEAKQKGTEEGVYEASSPTIDVNNGWHVANAITNFKEINIYTGTINVYGPFASVKDVNVNAGILWVRGYNDYAMKLSGKLTINGGGVTAIGYSSDTENGFAVIGDVVLNKGSFNAYNDDYRAVKGSLTAATGFEFLQGDTSDPTKATKIEGTTSNSKYIWGKAVPKK